MEEGSSQIFESLLLTSSQTSSEKKITGVNPGIICTKSKFVRAVSLSPGPANNFGWVPGILRNMWKGGQSAVHESSENISDA